MSISVEQLAVFLARTEYFSRCTPGQVADAVGLFQILTVAAEEPVFEEGDSGDAWYVVIDGDVSVSKSSAAGGPDHQLATLEPGEGFGEMALIDNNRRMATISTNMDTVLAKLPRVAFNEMLDANHPAANRLLRAMAGVLCQRQRELTYILQDLVDDPGPQPRYGKDNIARYDTEALASLLKAALTQH
jgi:CRP-like cAMP-binding protein